ncbi:MAG: hypothetical protein AAF639_32435, partial [Chloroflexota bacterium]
VGAAGETTLGVLSSMAMYGVDKGYGIADGSLGEAAWKGAVIGGVMGAFGGSVAGYGGAKMMTPGRMKRGKMQDLITDFDEFHQKKIVHSRYFKTRYQQVAFDWLNRKENIMSVISASVGVGTTFA